ncbi:HEPN domain-containing protein [Sphingomicrobium aestuariivivum]|uniref:HEPN domain-containing protein n=1 Tax=Sphingomicrobium aestuariivivum TaxID=1582356 RepID=UPI001FD675B5|nr:HEPN domain-containing protein [Sphingomicrobium aestuariivivum]MCJ8191067.1 HEPN domain-containing protein [Sphingomicrobium aestuariivivum]
MTAGLSQYESLKKNIGHAKKIVAGVDPHECKTDLQHLKLQSYIFLCHAIIEEYVEQLCLEVAKAARVQFVEEGLITKALVALIAAQVLQERGSGKASKKIGSELVRNLDEFSREAFNRFNSVVSSNNGIKKENVRALFTPIGVDPMHVDTALVNAMDALGTERGGIAHKFAIRRESTLSDTEEKIGSIVRDLEAFDEAAREALKIALAGDNA